MKYVECVTHNFRYLTSTSGITNTTSDTYYKLLVLMTSWAGKVFALSGVLRLFLEHIKEKHIKIHYLILN